MFAAAAFFMSSRIKPEIPAVPVLTPALEAGAGALEAGAGALEAGAGALAGELPVPSLNSFSPLVLLKLLLTSLGIPVHHLVEGSRKCVTELGPEAVGALQSLLVKGAPATPLCAPPSPVEACPPLL